MVNVGGWIGGVGFLLGAVALVLLLCLGTPPTSNVRIYVYDDSLEEEEPAPTPLPAYVLLSILFSCIYLFILGILVFVRCDSNSKYLCHCIVNKKTVIFQTKFYKC